MAALRRVLRSGTKSANCLTKFRAFNVHSTSCSSQSSQDEKVNKCLLSTLKLVRGNLEARGLPSKQAETVTKAINGVLNDNLKKVARSFGSKEHEAGLSLNDFKRRMEKLCKKMDSDVAEFVALVKESEREMKDFYESEFVATEKYLRKIAIGTVVCFNGAFIFAST